jgi:regulator-associated protein of mTOR
MVSACPRVDPEMLLKIPGQLNDRNSPLGDMNWLLLAVLETIAFQSYPLAEFRKLFRSNSGLAGLARGFILA